MRHLWARLIAAWVRFWTETANSDAGFLELIVNLAYLRQVRPAPTAQIIVLVNSRREASLLRLLRLARVIPWCRVRVVHRAADLRDLADNHADGRLLVATLQLFLKQHQAVAALRRQSSVVVI